MRPSTTPYGCTIPGAQCLQQLGKQFNRGRNELCEIDGNDKEITPAPNSTDLYFFLFTTQCQSDSVFVQTFEIFPSIKHLAIRAAPQSVISSPFRVCVCWDFYHWWNDCVDGNDSNEVTVPHRNGFDSHWTIWNSRNQQLFSTNNNDADDDKPNSSSSSSAKSHSFNFQTFALLVVGQISVLRWHELNVTKHNSILNLN